MLKRLLITNFAIIENVDLKLEDGFSVLTGETGAGKSLLIDSLSLLLGERASAELIRQGEEKATIKGIFDGNIAPLKAILSRLDIPEEEDLTIERTLTRSKSVSKVNGTPVSLNDLSLIASYLCDIHSQFDYAKILNPDNYLSTVDSFSKELVESYRKKYDSALRTYKEKKEKLLSLLEKRKTIEENRDFYEYQFKELSAMNLRPGEEERIESELSLLKNYDKVYALEEEAKGFIGGSFLDDFYELSRVLSKLSSYQPQYKKDAEELEDRYYEIRDSLNSLKKGFGALDYDPSRLDELQERSNDLESLKRKYKKSVSELILYREELKALVGSKEDLASEIKEAKEEKEAAFEDAYRKGEELSLVRKKLSKRIEKELEESLKSLLLDVKFEISFAKPIQKDDSSLFENGIDAIDFLIETNEGEGLKSLSKVLSGGEASRIMLAFKALLVRAHKIPTVVFDEIDTGLSGLAAEAVAKKIYEISRYSQVLAITHMPQVASLSDHHILVSKEVKGGRTFASVRSLSLEEKIKEVATLISGGKVTEKQLEYAKEMVLSRGD